MQLSQSQVQQLTQELRLTPQQILQSTILQLATLALEARVNQELEQNPVLEEEDTDTQDSQEVTETESDSDDGQEIDWEDILPQNDDYQPKQEFDRSKVTLKQIQQSPRGLVDYLLDQMKLLNLSDIEEKIALEIIWNIDDRGYLTLPIENVARTLNVTEAKAQDLLKLIQQFDPPGISARDLRECLLIQLGQMSDVDDAVTIVKDHFDDFANRRFQKLMKRLEWNKERIQAVQDVILKLNPKPGASLVATDSGYVVPDLVVEKVGGNFIIEVSDTRVPELRISPGYIQMMVKGSSITAETRTYLKKKIDMAKWFIQAIHQRRVTMIRVMKAIINRQKEFFDGNEKALKPMILKDIAEDVNMDISTISRVTNGKYVQLNSGVYELKYFFNEGMKDNNGEEVSTSIIKDKLKQIITFEDKHKPYSDDQLSILLKKAGYPIARRTVAKYREQNKIPVARLRRNI